MSINTAFKCFLAYFLTVLMSATVLAMDPPALENRGISEFGPNHSRSDSGHWVRRPSNGEKKQQQYLYSSSSRSTAEQALVKVESKPLVSISLPPPRADSAPSELKPRLTTFKRRESRVNSMKVERKSQTIIDTPIAKKVQFASFEDDWKKMTPLAKNYFMIAKTLLCEPKRVKYLPFNENDIYDYFLKILQNEHELNYPIGVVSAQLNAEFPQGIPDEHPFAIFYENYKKIPVKAIRDNVRHALAQYKGGFPNKLPNTEALLKLQELSYQLDMNISNAVWNSLPKWFDYDFLKADPEIIANTFTMALSKLQSGVSTRDTDFSKPNLFKPLSTTADNMQMLLIFKLLSTRDMERSKLFDKFYKTAVILEEMNNIWGSEIIFGALSNYNLDKICPFIKEKKEYFRLHCDNIGSPACEFFSEIYMKSKFINQTKTADCYLLPIARRAAPIAEAVNAAEIADSLGLARKEPECRDAFVICEIVSGFKECSSHCDYNKPCDKKLLHLLKKELTKIPDEVIDEFVVLKASAFKSYSKNVPSDLEKWSCSDFVKFFASYNQLANWERLAKGGYGTRQAIMELCKGCKDDSEKVRIIAFMLDIDRNIAEGIVKGELGSSFPVQITPPRKNKSSSRYHQNQTLNLLRLDEVDIELKMKKDKDSTSSSSPKGPSKLFGEEGTNSSGEKEANVVKKDVQVANGDVNFVDYNEAQWIEFLKSVDGMTPKLISKLIEKNIKTPTDLEEAGKAAAARYEQTLKLQITNLPAPEALALNKIIRKLDPKSHLYAPRIGIERYLLELKIVDEDTSNKIATSYCLSSYNQVRK